MLNFFMMYIVDNHMMIIIKLLYVKTCSLVKVQVVYICMWWNHCTGIYPARAKWYIHKQDRGIYTSKLSCAE